MPIETTTGPNGLPLLRLSTPGSIGEIFLQRAHLASWTPTGHLPVLWTSGSSRFAANTPIRGGVPLCFPWFGMHEDDPAAPMHGFARITAAWTHIDTTESAESVGVTFRLTDSPETRASAWPHRFEAFYTVTMGAALEVAFEVVNRDSTGFTFEEALHSYYAVGDIRSTRITGLEQLPYREKGMPANDKDTTPVQARPGISRRYTGVTTATIEDAENRRAITVGTENPGGAVVWNPGPEIAGGMEDFDDDGWKNMLCIENCNIAGGAIHLEPGERHKTQVTVSVAPLAEPATKATGTS